MTVHVLAWGPFALSAVATLWLYRGLPESRSEWIAHLLASGSIVTLSFLAGPWALTSVYLRYLLLGLFAAAAIYSSRKLKRGRTSSVDRLKLWKGRLLVPGCLVLVFSSLTVWIIFPVSRKQTILECTFPLRDGVY